MDVDVVAKSLKSHGFNAAPIHGDLDQSQRTKTLDGFRDGTLAPSGRLGRGGARPGYSGGQPCLQLRRALAPRRLCPPHRPHRVRAGRLGKAYTISVPSDEKYLKAIEGLIKSEIPRGAVRNRPAKSGARNVGTSVALSAATKGVVNVATVAKTASVAKSGPQNGQPSARMIAPMTVLATGVSSVMTAATIAATVTLAPP
jgi:superfamily II DNA/RNA helicase